ncbi:hypothetical protein BG846_00250 [Streptomyces fradiae ATCC 10745 = DSM 40063]|uniref:Uncharacterized protein n=1 Tax=Streptomyces fradiae ATCC 10745 = DSM 40063 TaxID=1319510 RepID=A0A1Y2P3D2_STRFR|nr:hypothetical protein BG846_00250 [Streptomyces fradiae ATCC 10745 = DSM 40063]
MAAADGVEDLDVLAGVGDAAGQPVAEHHGAPVPVEDEDPVGGAAEGEVGDGPPVVSGEADGCLDEVSGGVRQDQFLAGQPEPGAGLLAQGGGVRGVPSQVAGGADVDGEVAQARRGGVGRGGRGEEDAAVAGGPPRGRVEPYDPGPPQPGRTVLDPVEGAAQVGAGPEPAPGQLGGRRYAVDGAGQPGGGRRGAVQFEQEGQRAGRGVVAGEGQGEAGGRRGAVGGEERDAPAGRQVGGAVAVGPHGGAGVLGEREDGDVVVEGEGDPPVGVAGEGRPGGDDGNGGRAGKGGRAGNGGAVLPGGEAQHGGGGPGGARRFDAEQPQDGDDQRVRHLVEPVEPLFEEVGEEFEEGDARVDGGVQGPDAAGLGGDAAADGRGHLGPGEVVQLGRGQGHGVLPGAAPGPVSEA